MTGIHPYQNMSAAELNAAYNNRESVENWAAIHDDWTTRSASVYACRNAWRDVRYGQHSRQRLDLFPANVQQRPTLFYVHGGYWQWNNKEEEAFIAEGPLTHEVNVVLCEYRLCPTVSFEEVVADVTAAIKWLVPRLESYGAHPGQLIVSGSSAGAHLAAMLLDQSEVKAALLISGIYDLEPIRRSWLNDALGLNVDQARRASPSIQVPETSGPICLAVGADELPELRWQTQNYHRECAARGLPARETILSQRNHFTILDDLADPQGQLNTGLLELCHRIAEC